MNKTTQAKIEAAARTLFPTNADTQIYVTDRSWDVWHMRIPNAPARERITPTHAVRVGSALFPVGYGPLSNVLMIGYRLHPEDAQGLQIIEPS